MMIYEPEQDSFLLQQQVKKLAKGTVLDVGTGSGIQSETAAKKKSVKKVIAVDINKKAIEHCKKNIKNKKITFRKSDLFSNVKEKFDTIIFNPPYLPQDKGIEDLALYGGKKGHETIARFLSQANSYLKPGGIILLLFSSLTKKKKVEELIANVLLEQKELSKKHVAFEDLYVYRLKKSKLLKNLEKKGLSNLSYFAKGKRGIIYVGNYRNKKVAVKTKRKESFAVGRMKNEAKYLKLLNKKSIGPKFLFSGTNFLVYDFVEGVYIKDWLETAKKAEVKRVLKAVLMQCYEMDKLEINKEEMHHPLKHVIISKKIALIDFERCYKTKKPHNVTQFLQFVRALRNVLKEKGMTVDSKELIGLSREYKETKSLNSILSFLKDL